MRPRSTHPRLLAAIAAVLLAAGPFAPPGAPPAAAAKEEPSKRELKRQLEAAREALPEKYRQWLAEVEVLISDDELRAFLALSEDYHRDAFIERFWKVRDPYPGTGRNEFRDRYEAGVTEALERYGNFTEDRARIRLIHGSPALEIALRCGVLVWPTEVWAYQGSTQLDYPFFLIFVQRWGGGRFQIWSPQPYPPPSRGLEEVFQDEVRGVNPSVLLEELRNGCYKGDEVASIFAYVLNQGFFDYGRTLAQVDRKPEAPGGEWVATFAAYSTELPEGAELLEGSLEIAYPGRRQSRTVLQGLITVPREAAGEAALGEHRSYNFILTGEVLTAGDDLFDSFRYKFDFPAAEVPAGEAIPMVFQRYLRPGAYRLLLKLEDLNSKRFFHADRQVEVPLVAAAPPPPPDPETARLLAEANAAITTGEVSLAIVEPQGERLLTGMHRFDTLITGEEVDRVVFSLDDTPVLTKKRPPFSVELDLGMLPRPRTLRAAALDAAGVELAADELLLNASSHRFSVRLVEPRRGASYRGSLRARAEVQTPDGQPVERVEFFLNETRVATLYQEPWVQPIVLPEGDPVAYVQAVAFLPDGNSTQDLAFINAPDLTEEMNIEFVELYTTVLDRGGRPVAGLERGDFTVFEDGVEQEIRRFELVRDLPIHATVLMDVSASMEERIDATRTAALQFFEQTISPKDRASIITFNDRPQLAVKFTGDTTRLAGGLAGLKAERGTALYDALIFSLYYFNGISGQRALLLLSDGKDESSRFSFDDALEYAQRAGVTIYVIGLDLPKAGRRELARFAAETGGRSFFIASPAELPAIYASIEEELRSQYLIAYQSTNTSGARDFRTVDVKVARSGLEPKTLRGYYP